MQELDDDDDDAMSTTLLPRTVLGTAGHQSLNSGSISNK